MARRVLILGGTTEARELCEELGGRAEFEVTVSLAGRTAAIPAQAVALRVGGFGGAQGLAEHLRAERIDALIDATHPYAEIISRSAIAAAELARVPFLALRRPPWQPLPGDRWIAVGSVSEAALALGAAPRRVFLALGRQEIAPFAAAPQHFYLVRSVDPVDPPLPVPRAVYVLERGPFGEAADRALLAEHAIDVVVSRNSGGRAAYAKIAAARALAIDVLMVRRPPLPAAPSADSVQAALAWLDHAGARPAERGV